MSKVCTVVDSLQAEKEIKEILYLTWVIGTNRALQAIRKEANT